MAKRFISKQAADAQEMIVMVKSGKSDPRGPGTRTPSGKQDRDNPSLNFGGSHHVAKAISRWSVCNSTRSWNICEFLHHLKHNLLSEKHIHFCFSLFIFLFSINSHERPEGLSLPVFNSQMSLFLPSVRAKPGLLLCK